MITRTRRRVTGTTAALGVVMALAACSSPPPAPAASLTPQADMVAAHPSCAGRTAVAADAGVTCTADGHLWVLYAYPSRAAADTAAAGLATIHPTGTVSVESTPWGARVWVTE